MSGSKKSTMPSLLTAAVDLAQYREQDQQMVGEFISLVCGNGPITLVFDPVLMPPLNITLSMDSLMAMGITHITSVAKIARNVRAGQNRNFCWLLRADNASVGSAAYFIRDAEPGERHVIAFVPRRTLMCDRLLEPVAQSIEKVVSMPISLFGMEDDVLSMELARPLRSAVIDNDYSVCYDVAQAIGRLQENFGVIPKIHGKGFLAQKTVEILLRTQEAERLSKDDAEEEEEDEDEEPRVPEFNKLILIDRMVDMVTPMLTQQTYEGILDEIFGIKCGHLSVPGKVLLKKGEKPADPAAAEQPKVFAMNSTDEIFATIRDLNVYSVRGKLREFYEKLKAHEEARPKDSRDLQALATWTKELRPLMNLDKYASVHTNIYNYIERTYLTKQEYHDQIANEQLLIIGKKEKLSSKSTTEPFIEETILRGEPFEKVLRLLVLHSQTIGAMKGSVYDNLKKEIYQTYGIEALFTLRNLEELGLIAPRDTKAPFGAVRDKLNLCPDMEDPANADDPACVFGGYCPMIARLAQYLERPEGWQDIDDLLRQLPGGAPFEIEQSQVKGRPVTLVFVIGGITFAEISAIRQLTKLEGSNTDYIIASTDLITGSTLISSFIETVPTTF